MTYSTVTRYNRAHLFSFNDAQIYLALDSTEYIFGPRLNCICVVKPPFETGAYQIRTDIIARRTFIERRCVLNVIYLNASRNSSRSVKDTAIFCLEHFIHFVGYCLFPNFQSQNFLCITRLLKNNYFGLNCYLFTSSTPNPA